MAGDIAKFEHGQHDPTVIAVNRAGDLGALLCLRTSRDGTTWTSDTIIVTRSADGTWEDAGSGGTTFPAIPLDDPGLWTDGWTVAGETVRLDNEDAEGHARTVTAVSGFCAPDVDVVQEVGVGGGRPVTPAPMGAFVVISTADPVAILAVRLNGNRTDPILF